MERGEGVVAKWTLDAAQGEELVRLNQGSITLPAGATEVVFAEDAVYIGGRYHMMDRVYRTTARLEGSYLELNNAASEFDTRIRIPVPPGCEGDAERVARHYNS